MRTREKQPLRDDRYVWRWRPEYSMWHCCHPDAVNMKSLKRTKLRGREYVEHWNNEMTECVITKLRGEVFHSTIEPIEYTRRTVRL